MEKIKEVIVVEGKHDTQRLKKLFDVDTIETNGLGLSKDTLKMIKQINDKRGIIIFTDPDAPGNKIRSLIEKEIGKCKHAFISDDDCRDKHKVGVEHGSDEAIIKALNNVISTEFVKDSISYKDYIELGLTGSKDSYHLRNKVSKKLNIGLGNGKRFYRWIKMLGITKEELERVINES